MSHRSKTFHNTILLRIGVCSLILLSLGVILYHPIEHFDGVENHPDCPLCQMLNGQAPIPEFSSWLLIALFAVLFERINPPIRIGFYSSLCITRKSPRSPPFSF